MAQVRQVVSEALQATVRRLLPSQQGFTEDLQASNVITPIIDLTPTAEGSLLDVDFARALAFGSQTAFSSLNSTNVIANTPGFYRINAGVTVVTGGSVDNSSSLSMSDGLSTKVIWSLRVPFAGSSVTNYAEQVDLIVFLSSGESISAVTTAQATMRGSVRQIADVNGETINPSGFVSQ